jgi:hypothetical protein
MDQKLTTQGDNNVNQQQPVTDDQELAKVLEGVTQQAQTLGNEPASPTASSSGLQFEETPAAAPQPPATLPAVPDVPDSPAPGPASPVPVATDDSASPAAPGQVQLPPELESIKKDALEELRPLVPKLDLPPEDKFNTILLVIRSTDDQSLVGAAHDAAKSIENESKRAQALLDIIREIDYFANQGK